MGAPAWTAFDMLEQLVLLVMIVTLLPMRRRSLYAVAFVAVSIARATVLRGYVEVRFVLYVGIILFLLPLLLYRARPVQKMLAASLTCIMVSLELALPLWISGQPQNGSDLQLHAVVSATCMFVLFAGYSIAGGRIRRLGEVPDMPGLGYAAALPASQAVMIMTFGLAVMPWSLRLQASVAAVTGAFAAFAVCYGLVLLLFSYFEKCVAAAIAWREAELLEQNLDACLRQYDAVLEEIESVSRIRHDMGNHLQVIDSLIGNGQTAAAAAYLRDVAAYVKSASMEAGAYGQALFVQGGDYLQDAAIGGGESSDGDASGIAAPARLSSMAESARRADDAGLPVHAGPIALVFPASQLAIVLWAVWTVSANDLPLMTLVPIIAVAFACIPFDLSLTRLIAEAKSGYLAREVESFLNGQVASQQSHLLMLERDLQAARADQEAMLDLLGDIGRALDEGDVAGAAARLGQAASPYRGRGRSFCANPAVDALLQTKVAGLESLGARVRVGVDVPSDVGIDPTSLCAVFANLIDNASNGCQMIDRNRREVDIVATVRAGCLMLEVANTCEKDVKVPSRRARGREVHGWGVGIVEALVERNGGAIDMNAEDGRFSVSVMLRTSPQRRDANTQPEPAHPSP